MSPTFKALDVGPGGESLEFELLVLDKGGLQSVDSCIVNISWLNETPVADAGENQTVDAGSVVILDASGSYDIDDGIASFIWTQISGSTVTLSDSAAVSPTFTAPDVDSDGETFVFELTVEDNSGLKDTSECTIKINPVLHSQAMSLSNSWNLVSLYRSPSDKTIGSVLGAISGEFISVWAYTEGQWHVYDPLKPGFCDLKEMSAGKGYWFNMINNTELHISGFLPERTISLVQGWNLVGYNSTASKQTSEAISSITDNVISVWAYKDGQWEVYDPQKPGFSNLENMEPGYGYWIKVNAPCTWTN